jgi:RNA polymerase sigma-70 factor (ECF subfamily)
MTINTLDEEKLHIVRLVTAAQAGDQGAFNELFTRFERHVLSLALRKLGDFAEAEELTQEVLLQAWLKLGQLREPEAFAGWLRAITARMAINRITRRRIDRAVEPETLEAVSVDETTPLDTVLAAEEEDRLHEGLSRLRETDRETLVAFYVDGRSLLEMSDDFDAPLGTIKRRLHVARKRLAKEVDELTAV